MKEEDAHVDPEAMRDMIAEWNRNRKSATRDKNDLRLGQFLMNSLLPKVSCSEVFYCEDPREAVERFCNRFCPEMRS